MWKTNNPWRITIDTNPDQCNLNCIMCDTHSIYKQENPPKRQRMSPDILRKILQQAVKLGIKEIIPSTMGEPLLYPYFDEFIENLKGTTTKLNLTTNGTFPKKGAEVWARELLPITSDTKISINAISKSINESIMINSDTESVLNFDKFSEDIVPCPFLGKELWIDCYGNYHVCCAPSEKRKELGDFGHIDDITIDQFFMTDSYQKLLKNYNYCVVKNKLFFHIDKYGNRAYQEQYTYVGDYKYGIAVAINDLSTHIDTKGQYVHGQFFLDLDVYHKGYAIAKDDD